MQNKPKVKIGKMNLSIAIIRDYDNEQRTISNELSSKQTQTNPIQTQFKPNQTQNKPDSNPIFPPRRDEIRHTPAPRGTYYIRHTTYEPNCPAQAAINFLQFRPIYGIMLGGPRLETLRPVRSWCLTSNGGTKKSLTGRMIEKYIC